jgi:hypothetical protein
MILLLSSLAELSVRLLTNPGLLLRGAVSKGKLYHRGGVMFGPTFLEAYSIEKSIAKVPRIILSREVYEDMKNLRAGAPHPTFLLADDGPPYLHVFAPLLEGSDADRVRAATCKTMIEQKLTDSIHNPAHYEKMRWLAIYWNSNLGPKLGPTFRVSFPNTPPD